MPGCNEHYLAHQLRKSTDFIPELDFIAVLEDQLGYSAILIYGDSGYYQRFGFRPAKDFGIMNGEGRYPIAHMTLEL